MAAILGRPLYERGTREYRQLSADEIKEIYYARGALHMSQAEYAELAKCTYDVPLTPYLALLIMNSGCTLEEYSVIKSKVAKLSQRDFGQLLYLVMFNDNLSDDKKIGQISEIISMRGVGACMSKMDWKTLNFVLTNAPEDKKIKSARAVIGPIEVDKYGPLGPGDAHLVYRMHWEYN